MKTRSITTLLFVVLLAGLAVAVQVARAQDSGPLSNTVDDSKGRPASRASVAVAYGDISSAGPLTHIYAGADASVQVSHALDSYLEFYPPQTIPGDSGTFLVVDGILYAPDFNSRDSATNGLGTFTAFEAVSQTSVQGAGTAADPFRVVTIVDAGPTGLRVIQTDTYVVGQEGYRTDLRVSNSSGSAKNIVLYRAGDCYLGNSDYGYGVSDPGVGSIACTKNPNNDPADRILQYVPLTDGSHYYEANYGDVWRWIATKQEFPDTCRCEE